MLRPRIPTNPLPTGIVTGTARNDVPAVPHQSPAPMSATPAPVRPTVQLTPGAVVAAIGGVTVVVLVVGAVLVSMLLAVAVTAASLAISALIVRSLVASQNHR
ncbi:SpdD-like protein [Streptomyces anulatus]|uniref:SpdD-like protein n=1 Tax=Streptomyces anulatus TaxID=1892 RepID=UPI002E154F6C|nr:SpdD-like protein [Streptomyces anulatus]WTD10778.1 SpdD-like protein [Streptomyces anulatus]WTE04085.1 SpdD-like protein [Streptomyces anulatus]